jgi:hypothetical protein
MENQADGLVFKRIYVKLCLNEFKFSLNIVNVNKVFF